MEGADTGRRHMFHYPYNHQSDCHTSNIRASPSSPGKFIAVWRWDSHQPVKYRWNVEPAREQWNRQKYGIRLNKSLQIEKFRAFLFYNTCPSTLCQLISLTSRRFLPLLPEYVKFRGWSAALSNILTTLHKQAWPPPSSLFSLFLSTRRRPFCHGTPVRDCLRVAEPVSRFGPQTR